MFSLQVYVYTYIRCFSTDQNITIHRLSQLFQMLLQREGIEECKHFRQCCRLLLEVVLGAPLRIKKKKESNVPYSFFISQRGH